MIAALILAAGASTRLGSPKQLVELDRETLLDRTVRIATEAGCSPVLVVLGASADLIKRRCNLRNTTVLHNALWSEGMASSIRLGIATLSESSTSAAIILSCDMPAVTPAHLRALIATGVRTASHYEGRRGIPAFFLRADFDTLLTLQGDQGARSLLQTAPSLDLIDGHLDIDTPEDIAQMRSANPPVASP